MTVTIKTLFKKTTKSDGFHTDVTIIDASDIGLDVLVFETDTDDFSHVATVFDYETYPASKAAAKTMNLKFYRSRGVSRVDSTLVGALEFETITKARIKSLAVAWEQADDGFGGEEVVTFDSSTKS